MMLGLEILGLIALQLYDLHYALSVFQQCHYHLDRYRNWVAEHFSIQRLWRRIQSFLPFLFFLFLKVESARSPSILCVILIYLYVRLQRMKEDRRGVHLRFTNRMCRLSICLLVLAAIVTVFVRTSLSYELYVCLIPFLWMLGWVLLPVASCLVQPIERILQERYVQDARIRLDTCPQLLRIGISGSYGKTSVKHIAYALLKDSYYTLMTPHSYNNRMGITRTIREQLDPLHEVFLCEMGSDHSGELKELLALVRPSICIVTAIGPQHLRTFGSQEAIIQEKMTMIERLPKEGIGILNIDNPFIRSYPLQTTAKIITYGFSEDADVRIVTGKAGVEGTYFVLEVEGKCYPFHTRLLGDHNLLNIAAAIALARELHVSMEQLQTRVDQLPYVEHRLEMKRIEEGILIDDAYNANPQGALAACRVLAQMSGWRVLITPGFVELGEQQKTCSHAFGKAIAQSADEVFLVGEEQVEEIRCALDEEGFPAHQIHHCAHMEEALSLAKQVSHTPKVILIENDIPHLFSH